MAPAAMVAVFMYFGLLWLDWRRDACSASPALMHRRNTWSTGHYSINLRVVLEVVWKVFLHRFVAHATPPRSVHDFFICFPERFIFIRHLDTVR